MAAGQLPPLAMILAEVEDGRQARGRRHNLEAMLRLAVIGLMCGYTSIGAIAEWGPNHGEAYREMLGFGRHGWPGRSTWYRVMAGVTVARLEAVLGQWMETALKRWADAQGQAPGIALDGKTLRGSRRQGATEAHILSAVAHEIGLTLGQIGVDEKTNEIGMVEQLLASLTIQGRVVTADALLTQKAVARHIIEAGGDYVLPVKDNQLTLRVAIDEHLDRQQACGRAESVEKRHGRTTIRAIQTSSGLADRLDWPGVAQVFRITRSTRRSQGRSSHEVVHGITSLSESMASPDRLLALNRGHWTIENRSHWVRDVVLDEDRSQIRSGHAHQVMAALRNTAIALLRLSGFDCIASTLRSFAAQPSLPIQILLTAPP